MTTLCTCSFEDNMHEWDCDIARDARFADLAMAYINAEIAHERNPSDREAKELYLELGRQYNAALRERLDAKAQGRQS